MLAVFASDKGPGDPERASMMSQAGTFLGRKGASLVCLADRQTLNVPLITSARASGGTVLLVADNEIVLPHALDGIAIERLEEAEQRERRVAGLCEAFVGLPGSLASASSLYSTWVRGGAGTGRKPMVLLNRNRAFEVIRGFTADVLSHSVPEHDRLLQFADTIEDLWARLTRLLA